MNRFAPPTLSKTITLLCISLILSGCRNSGSLVNSNSVSTSSNQNISRDSFIGYWRSAPNDQQPVTISIYENGTVHATRYDPSSGFQGLRYDGTWTTSGNRLILRYTEFERDPMVPGTKTERKAIDKTSYLTLEGDSLYFEGEDASTSLRKEMSTK